MKTIILIVLLISFPVIANAGPDFFWADSEQNMALAQDALIRINIATAGMSIAITVGDYDEANEFLAIMEAAAEEYNYYGSRVWVTVPLYPYYENAGLMEKFRGLVK